MSGEKARLGLHWLDRVDARRGAPPPGAPSTQPAAIRKAYYKFLECPGSETVLSEESIEKSVSTIDKAAIDASQEDSWLIYSERAHVVSAENFSNAIDRILRRMQEHGTYLDLRPLRLILLTSELHDRAKDWQRQLGRPEAGVSQQTEGVVGGKTMSWGEDGDSARTIILLNDALAAGAVLDMPAAVATVAHEFGHVTDYYQRRLLYGFPTSDTPLMNDDWHGICREAADSVWSEYVAESAASLFTSEQELEEFRQNDIRYLAGVDACIRQSVLQFKAGQISRGTLWNSSVTNIFDLLTNLGRAVARVSPEESGSAVGARLSGTEAAARWAPVIEKMLGELRTLRSKRYEDWSLEPFAGLEDAVEVGFHTLGLVPDYDGSGLRLRVL